VHAGGDDRSPLAGLSGCTTVPSWEIVRRNSIIQMRDGQTNKNSAVLATLMVGEIRALPNLVW